MGAQTSTRQPSTQPSGSDDHEPLTPAEHRLLTYLPSRRTLNSIAGDLFVAHSTAKTHSLAVYRKLRVNNRAAAIERAIELGLLPPANANGTRGSA